MYAPIKITRAPTRYAVEALCKEKGLKFQVYKGEKHREYAAITDGLCIPLGMFMKGTTPDWRAMLQRLGSDWA